MDAVAIPTEPQIDGDAVAPCARRRPPVPARRARLRHGARPVGVAVGSSCGSIRLFAPTGAGFETARALGTSLGHTSRSLVLPAHGCAREPPPTTRLSKGR